MKRFLIINFISLLVVGLFWLSSSSWVSFDNLCFFCFVLFFVLFCFVFLKYLFRAVLGLRFCARAFSSCGKQGPLFIAVCGPLTIVTSFVAEHRLPTRRLSSVAHGPSCSAACGIFPDQGSNPCPLHWQADSQPLHHQGSPITCVFLASCPYHRSCLICWHTIVHYISL